MTNDFYEPPDWMSPVAAQALRGRLPVNPAEYLQIHLEVLWAARYSLNRDTVYERCQAITSAAGTAPPWCVIAVAALLVRLVAGRYGQPPTDKTDDPANARWVLGQCRSAAAQEREREDGDIYRAELCDQLIDLALVAATNPNVLFARAEVFAIARANIFDVWYLIEESAALIRYLAKLSCPDQPDALLDAIQLEMTEKAMH